ncbi:MAG: 50S ribosomal protein L13, partial [Lachnospiraceae bacterium]
TIERKWYVVDATGYTLGRLASEVAKVLRGKNKPTYTPSMDTGDYVIVINAEKISVTGKKLDQKVYYNHSGWVGGLKETTLREMLNKHPERVIEHAVKGMLPKGPLGREMYTKLHVYVGPDHKHAAQKPEVLTF